VAYCYGQDPDEYFLVSDKIKSSGYLSFHFKEDEIIPVLFKLHFDRLKMRSIKIYWGSVPYEKLGERI
jgi:hypothetical protein